MAKATKQSIKLSKVEKAEKTREKPQPKNEITTAASLGLAPEPVPEIVPEAFFEAEDIDIVEEGEENTPEMEQVAEKPAEVVQTPVVVDSTPGKSPNVRVKPKEDFKGYYGDKWYYFKKGVQQSIPAEYKDRLLTAGKLIPL
jgi:hypothetical protein